MAAKEMTTGQYAEHRGVTPQAVRKAIKQGRILRNEHGRIEVALADKMWAENTRPWKRRK